DPQGCVHLIFFFAGGRRHTSSKRDLSSDVCSSDLDIIASTSNVSRYSIEHIGQQSRRKYGLLCFQRILHANNIASCIIGGKLPRSEERRGGHERRSARAQHCEEGIRRAAPREAERG